METEIVQAVDQMGPYVAAALAAYGANVLSRAEDAAADATVNAGRQILLRVWNRISPTRRAMLQLAVEDAVTTGPAADDGAAVLRMQLRQAMSENPQLVQELRNLLASAPRTVTASGERSVAVGGESTGVVNTGDGAHITVHGRHTTEPTSS
ncbi:hypothetical protein OG912_38065 (plasmid) [Streptomyces sp. NBC_00464]|uniref:hypothetical protein n=1 Tax=Streptomyces sp. NBC_00464 TaxID=2975751 RepID=UPI002E195173